MSYTKWLWNRSSRRASLLAVALGAACIAVAGCGVAAGAAATAAGPGDSSPESGAPVQKQQGTQGDAPASYAPVRSQWGDTPVDTPDEAVAEALKGLDSDIFLDLHLGTPPDDRNIPNSWLYATVKVSSMDDSATQLPRWEASLAEGVIAEKLATSRVVSDAILGSSITAVMPDGSTADLGGGIGYVLVGQKFDDSADSVVIDDIQAKLTAAGVSAEQVRVLHPQDNAVYIVGVVQDIRSVPQGFMGIVNEVFGDLNVTDAKYEGYYLQLDDSDGNPIAIGTAAFRIGAGSSWINPVYEGVAGVVHG